MAHNEFIGKGYKYYKIKAKGTDKWFVGKLTKGELPRGADGISLYDYMLMKYGKAVTMSVSKHLAQVSGSHLSSIVVENENRENLPDVNSTEFKKLIN